MKIAVSFTLGFIFGVFFIAIRIRQKGWEIDDMIEGKDLRDNVERVARKVKARKDLEESLRHRAEILRNKFEYESEDNEESKIPYRP